MTPASLCDSLSTRAGAPAPNNTATLRLSQSMYWEISSTPITSAFLTMPLLIIDEPIDSPYMKLVQAVLTSKAAARVAPIRCCTPDALLGTSSSLLQLPYITNSISLPDIPAQAIARPAPVM